jgi:ferritin-like metal-binding protein YciE
MILRSSLSLKGFGLAFGDAPRGYEILVSVTYEKGVGHRRLRPPQEVVRAMADDKLQQKLVDYVEDAHAMEQNDLKMIDSMISTTDDPQVEEMLQNHKRETEEHERRLRERLEAMGRGTSARKQAQAVGAALLKGVGDKARGDKAGKNARDGYMAEHLEIAAYQLLERLAQKAGDQETAEAARRNRSDEEEMARRIDQSWDRTLELTLEENGIRV